MQVIVLSNGKLEVKEIENTLEELQRIVGGYIEIPFLGGIFNHNKINFMSQTLPLIELTGILA